MKILSIKIPEPLFEKLEYTSEKTHTNKSIIVREAMALYFAKKEDMGSYYDQAREFCGCVKGPSDLSSNKDHMKDYGK